MFHSSGNSCLSTSIPEEVQIKDDQAYGVILPSNPSEADDSISGGHVTSKESGPPKLPWPKLPESCFSVAESNSVLIEGEESDVETRRSGLEPGEIPVIPRGERNGLDVLGVCGNVFLFFFLLLYLLCSGVVSESSMMCIEILL